jgi:hypothetical protein
MLNPSDGNETGDDMTIKRCINKAKDNGFGALEIVNLYSRVTRYPKDLWRLHKAKIDIIHPENDRWIADTCHGRTVVLACGANAKIKRFVDVLKILADAGITPKCCGKTDGTPQFPLHPLAVEDQVAFKGWE